jgi:thymidine kinase
MQQLPTFTVFTGAMFGSKTSRMLMELERYRYQHKNVAVFKPQIDTRYSTTDIVTHGGWCHTAICVTKGVDVLQHMLNADNDVSVVAVDEAFMIPGIAEVLIFLYQSGFSVVVSSLDIAANGKPFPEIVQMLPWATSIVKCAAVCTVCGRDAHFTYKKQDGGDELTVEVGGSDLYEPRCFFHFPVIATNLPVNVANSIMK